MSTIYKSIVYDLNMFGIFNIKRAIFTADIDGNVQPSISFNSGKTFKNITVNEDFNVVKSNGKVQLKLTFPDDQSSIYTIRSVGYLPNYVLGTVALFKKKSNGKIYKTTLGENGKFVIELPRGTYDVYVNSVNSDPVMTDYNPTIYYEPTLNHKENSIELFFKDVTWADYSIYDIFDNVNKMSSESTTIIDPYGDLSDGKTNRKVKYWALCFEV